MKTALERRKIEASKIEGMDEMTLNISNLTQRLHDEIRRQEKNCLQLPYGLWLSHQLREK